MTHTAPPPTPLRPRGWRHIGPSRRDCQGWSVGSVGGARGPDLAVMVAIKTLPPLRFIYSCGY